MDILSKLPERLKELMFDKGVNVATLAQAVGVRTNAITRYLSGAHIPKFETFVAIINYFNCSADFFLGISDEPNYNRNYLPVPAFSGQLRQVLLDCKISQYALQKSTKISWANFHYWLNGLRLPYPDNLYKIANALNISVDYLLGRVK